MAEQERSAAYELGKEVGRGAFAVVYLARRVADGRPVAIKRVLRKSRRSGVDWTALREVKLLQEMSHHPDKSPNIVGLLDVFALPGNINMVMELCPFDLSKVISTASIQLSDADVKSYMHMMLLGTKAIHDVWVLHRDLKPDNLLIGDDRQLKLADFGLARIFGEPDEQISYKVVTLPYRAPELLFGAAEYSVGVDVWSVGCIMAELILRKVFLPGRTDEDQLGKIFYMLGTPTEADWPKVASLPKFASYSAKPAVDLDQMFVTTSEPARSLLKGMLALDPAKRLTADQALGHAYFTSEPTVPTKPHDLPFDVLRRK